MLVYYLPGSPAAGYPFDLPPTGSGLPTYCALVYHLPLLIAFSVCSRTAFVWGGCVLMRAEGLRSDSHGILKVSRSGGDVGGVEAWKCGMGNAVTTCILASPVS